MVIDYREAG
jgi:hypothetical protein